MDESIDTFDVGQYVLHTHNMYIAHISVKDQSNEQFIPKSTNKVIFLSYGHALSQMGLCACVLEGKSH